MDVYADDAAAAAAFQLPPEITETDGPIASFASPQRSAGYLDDTPEVPEPEEETVPEFDPRYREPFRGLLYVGALSRSFELYGHSFTIATPTQAERLQIGPVVQPYQNTISGEIAYATALVAAYLVDIDGVKLPEPVVTNPKETALNDRFRWVTENLKKQVIDKVFDECLVLDSMTGETLEAMGKASG
jgi:hypothetical protein